MGIQQLAVECGPCQRPFIGEIVIWAPLEVSLASMREMRCPHCGSKKIFLLQGERYNQAAALLGLPPSRRGK